MDLELLDAKDVRQMLKVSLPLVYKLADQGRLPCVRIPCPGKGQVKPRTLVRFKLEDVRQFVERYYCNS
jgi:predicted DNA-binding transcriptional regulator AlpA